MKKTGDAIKINLKAKKKYSLCACGKSNSLPYCDNKHRAINDKKGTNYKSIKIFPVEDTTIYVSSSTWREEKVIRRE